MRDSLKKKRERKKGKKREENPRWGGIIRQKWHRLFQKRVPSCATAFPRSCRNFSRQFVYEGGKRVRGGVFSSPLPSLLRSPRNFFNIRIRVGPPTRAQSLPRRRRLSLFRVRERNFSFRGRAKQNPIGSIFHSRSQEDQSPDNFSTTFRRLINSFSLNDSRLNDSLRDSWTLRYPSISLSFSLWEAVSFFLIERVEKRMRLENEKKEIFRFSKSSLWERTFLLVGLCVLPLAKNASFPTLVGTKVCVF